MTDNNSNIENSSVVLYTNDDGSVQMDVRIDGDTVWLTQQQIALLYGKAKSTISEHISHIFEEGELDPQVVVREFRTTTQHGAIQGKTQTNTTNIYNLSLILAVGYRVRSRQGTLFRQWATQRLEEYIVKGFTIDSERLKGNGGGQYWYELLNTIKDIRSSEKVLYRQVLDLYATSVDYNASAEETRQFFKIVQNKLHYATHGQTAAEVIFNRADAEKQFMGLTTFRGTYPAKSDVIIAKNYLDENELRKLNNMVSGFFDFAENRALDHIPTTMNDYRMMLDRILSAGGYPLLDGAGQVSATEAHNKALEEYKKFQLRTLSPVEQAYIAQLEQEAKSIKKK